MKQQQKFNLPFQPFKIPCRAANCHVQVGLKVADLQEQSAVNRKQLADATREFKRSTAAAADSDYVAAVAGLLKRYQEEIDALTRRAKHGEQVLPQGRLLSCMFEDQECQLHPPPLTTHTRSTGTTLMCACAAAHGLHSMLGKGTIATMV